MNIEESTAHFYLRDEAQLIQGSGTTGNSGVGKLSVYQWGTVNQYAYNYWCSPVGNVLLNNTGNSAFRPNNNIYDFINAPTTSTIASYTSGYNGSSSPLVISNRWIWLYDPGIEYSEWDYVGDVGDVPAGYGFTMKGTSGSGNNQMYDFRGKPNSGTIATSVLAGQQTLTGNPYPSALDARDYIWDTDNQNAITGYLYYWEQAPGATSHYLEDYVGGYAAYTINSAGTLDSFTPAVFTTYLGDGTPTNLPAGSGTKIAKRYIPIGQGFMVEGKIGTTGTVYTKNAHRDFIQESSGNSYFFRSAESSNSSTSIQNTNVNDDIQYNEDGLTIVPNDYKRFRLNVDFNATGVYTRQLLMNFHATATPGFDYGLEAKSPSNLGSDAYWVLNNEPYVIQAFNFDLSLTIPVTVKIENQQTIKFRIFDIQNFDISQPIYLHDIETNTYIDLRQQNFETTLESGTYANRFEITFTSNALDVEEINENDLLVFQDNTIAELIIKNPHLNDLTSIAMYDITGKQLFNVTKLTLQEEYKFTTKRLSSGTYIVNINLASNQSLSKKVIVHN